VRVYITGTSGFVGRHLLRYLHGLGRYEVYASRVDITKSHKVKSELEKIRPDKVIHLAAIVSTPWADEADWYAFRVNVEGTYNVAKYSKLVGADFVYASSTSVYKPTSKLITEESAVGPTTLYNLTKWMGEEVTANVFGDGALILRLCHVYGPDGDHGSIPSRIISSALSGYPAILYASPRSVRSYLFIDDLLELFPEVLESNLGGVFNVSSEEYMRLGEVARIVLSELAKKGIPKPILVWRPETDYMGSHKVSSKKIASRLGWTPKTPFAEGIAKCVDTAR
jgi:nucleoside-diphosphate-sugar epimerase